MITLLLLSFCGHYTGQPALAGTHTPMKKWRILLERSCTSRMPLLTATSAFGLRGRRYSFFSTVLPAPSLYLEMHSLKSKIKKYKHKNIIYTVGIRYSNKCMLYSRPIAVITACYFEPRTIKLNKILSVYMSLFLLLSENVK